MPNEFVDLSLKNIRVWFLLAFQAGVVNAGGFLVCGRFVTHVTGFATAFGVELAGHHEGAALSILCVPFFFLVGAMLTAFFVELRLLHGKPANYVAPVFLIFLCFVAATIGGRLGLFGDFRFGAFSKANYLLIALLSFASGLQNALITNSQGVVVRTTHLSGMTTDLAVGLVRSYFSAPGRHVARDRHATFARAGIIGSFIAGSTLSAYLFLRTDYLGFAVPVVTSVVLLAYFWMRVQRKQRVHGDSHQINSHG